MKRFACILITVCLLAALCVLPLTAAEGDVTIRYGAENLPLTLIDPLNDQNAVFDGSYGFGRADVSDGKMLISVSGQYFDCYGMVTQALPGASFAGARYLALSLKNESDGDIFFGLQPAVTAGGANMFLSGELAKENPVKLVREDGTAKDAKWSGTRAINGRDCFIIPYKFSGFVLIPMGIVADLNALSTPVIAEDGGIAAYGFHVMADDAMTVQVTLHDVYICGTLPEYREPVEETTTASTEPATSTEMPTETLTEAPTETPTEKPTEPITEVLTYVETITVTENSAEASGDATTRAAQEDGCGSVLGLSGVWLMTLVGGTALTLKNLKKRH